MLLYHGTTEEVARKALTEGLNPRGKNKKRSNWKHTIHSNPDCVYLTTAYAGYFAANAVGHKLNETWGIVEVDTDKLNLDQMRPDEDMIAQAEALNAEKKGAKHDLFKRTLYWRARLDVNKHLWLPSVEYMGTCSHKGTIPAEAVTRVSLFKPSSNGTMVMACCDPTISIMNYKFCQQKYKLFTRWLMGEKVTYEEWSEATFFNLFGIHGGKKEIQEEVESVLARQGGIQVYRRNEEWQSGMCERLVAL